MQRDAAGREQPVDRRRSSSRAPRDRSPRTSRSTRPSRTCLRHGGSPARGSRRARRAQPHDTLGRERVTGRARCQGGDAAAVFARGVDREAAPAAADLEHVVVRGRGRACRRSPGASPPELPRASSPAAPSTRTSRSWSRRASAGRGRCPGRNGHGSTSRARPASAPAGGRDAAPGAGRAGAHGLRATARDCARELEERDRSSASQSPSTYDSPKPDFRPQSRASARRRPGGGRRPRPGS